MKTFKQVNIDLELNITSEWGIINSNGKRAKEFINYYNNNEIEQKTKIEFIDLICDSVNEALIELNVDNELNYLFKDYLYNLEETEINTMILVNWASYESTDIDPFPVSEIIKEVLQKKNH